MNKKDYAKHLLGQTLKEADLKIPSKSPWTAFDPAKPGSESYAVKIATLDETLIAVSPAHPMLKHPTDMADALAGAMKGLQGAAEVVVHQVSDATAHMKMLKSPLQITKPKAIRIVSNGDPHYTKIFNHDGTEITGVATLSLFMDAENGPTATLTLVGVELDMEVPLESVMVAPNTPK